ncbi:MAG TPA: pyridoxamine 5'-phosphate oxidase family protein [Aquihabitans sp.]|nr:pyridoxamine 5'-phosphate oxidase family protein [Aquihabitans sp.]
MTSWDDLTAAEPELAGRAHAILSSTTNAVLGTLRRDGSPRLSGIDPFFTRGDLWIGSMPGARKADDLRRDPRVALHGVPWESRRTRDGVEDPGEADVKVRGRAIQVDDATAKAVMADFTEQRDLDPGPGELFRIDVDDVVVVSVDGGALVVDRWSATGGRSTVRRT